MKRIVSKIISSIIGFAFIGSIQACHVGAFENVPPEQAKQMISNGGDNLLLLDVRTFGEHRNGHLKGAKLIPVIELSSRLNEIEKYRDKDILIYCASGMRSDKASALLTEKGFKRIYNMSGGISAWNQKGYEIVK